MSEQARPRVLFAHPFRPFFLLLGAYAALVVLVWIAQFFGFARLPLSMQPSLWHAHEMLFGMVGAAIAGFLLTAMCNWTGAPPLTGRRLQALVGLWLLGRIAMWLSGWLPALLVALLDLAFLAVLGLHTAQVLRRYGNRRNLFLAGIIGLLALANLLMHAEFNGVAMTARTGMVLGLNLITLMMVVIAGRITPAFTANWLRMQGGAPEQVRRPRRLDHAVIVSTALIVPLELFAAPAAMVGVLALVAAALNGLRLFAWRGWLSAAQPLLWILHLAYVWIVAALSIKGLQPFMQAITPSLWFHVLGAGAIGTLIIGVITRVCLGHTGRPLRLMRGAVLTYVCVLAAAVLRSLGAVNAGGQYSLLVNLSAVLWAGAFSLFVLLYWPILTRPRPDGRPG
ncbi:NnrS family protein [Alkalilimnicola sp. S0819]|uniref:NnrS family protein n=1 Tax=Alkalilimnicola sp. S0819 TaxID=2613922 RepID=UPI0012622C03|nr:NnrS family protein [Alkalilimnicola sp. S0819]KAB7622578.1 NnrS family protein [Alkalilimnicola sp. S0819]MPQ17466.1 NnrS family protein [Alkalilimnicola sp. S0819]